MEKTDGWFCFSQGLCGNFWFVCVTSILLCHLMGSWLSPRLFHSPVRAGSCCEMKSLLILLSHLFSFSHTPVHTNTPIGTNPFVLCLCPLMVPAPHWHSISWSTSCSRLVLGGQTLVGAVPWASLGSHWLGQVLAGAPLLKEGAGRYQSTQGLVVSGQRSCLFISWRPKALVLESHNRPSLFSHSTWGIMQVTQFFPCDFGSSQDTKKDVDICVFLGSMPPVMIEGFVWFSSFCWHYQQLLPLFLWYLSEAAVALSGCFIFSSVQYFPFFKIK